MNQSGAPCSAEVDDDDDYRPDVITISFCGGLQCFVVPSTTTRGLGDLVRGRRLTTDDNVRR
jgi:hypothetical protein